MNKKFSSSLFLINHNVFILFVFLRFISLVLSADCGRGEILTSSCIEFGVFLFIKIYWRQKDVFIEHKL